MSSRQFSMATMLRMVPKDLLGQFFVKMGHGQMCIRCNKVGYNEIPRVLTAIGWLKPEQQDRIESTLRTIFELACNRGIESIIEAAILNGDLNLPRQLPHESGPYAKAMWAWLNRLDTFDKATILHQVDNLSWWRKRHDLPRQIPNHSDTALKSLSDAISELLVEWQGRGQRCTIEYFKRGEGTDYFFAYPNDYLQNVLVHDDDGVLMPQTFRSTFVVVFAFNAEEGSLELFAKLPIKLKNRLESIFAQSILDHQLPTWIPDAAYELNHLKKSGFQLVTDPEDHVRATLRKVRFSFKHIPRRIVLEIGDSADNIYTMIDECLSHENVSKDDVNLSLATIAIEFLHLEGRKPGKLTFDVTWPSSCNLRNQRPERIEIARKYLKKWKIDVSQSVASFVDSIGDNAADHCEA